MSGADHIYTGALDKDGRELCVGDRIVYRNNPKYTKKEYLNPEYEVVWKAPAFGIKHVGGGKSGSSAHFAFMHTDDESWRAHIETLTVARVAPTATSEVTRQLIERDALQARLDSTGIVTHAPIFVSKTQVLEWRKEWMVDHPVADGEDHVTPFDGLLYQHVLYDKHAQRLRSAISNIKWSEVPLAKLEAIAAVLCDVGDDERVERAANAMCYFSTGETMADAWTDRDPDYWMELAKISAGVFK